ncbi:hypothetical protein TK11N_19990 [Tetragenococcus koreensis]|uniref:Uncharacterized protein n=1 Tax=Tetragenococcus koreensis TaxID=290335 RepID=A0ABQ0YCJ3_9ENTE|nr:hypothetical protein TK11N_19990 [Tetragenococcus koreensis]GEQ60161.1 hypothetical protein TK6N_20000 [Tetragenococcus koreensis]
MLKSTIGDVVLQAEVKNLGSLTEGITVFFNCMNNPPRLHDIKQEIIVENFMVINIQLEDTNFPLC